MSQHNPFIINPDGSQSPNPNYRGPRSYNRSAKANAVNAKPPKQSILGNLSTKASGVLGPVFRGMDVVNVMNPELSDKERGHAALGVINPTLGFITGSVLQPAHDWLSRVTDTEGAIYQGRGAGRAAFKRATGQRVLNDVKSKKVIGQNPVSKQEFDSGRNTEPPNQNPNVPQKGTSMGSSTLAPTEKRKFADIRGSITHGSRSPAPAKNKGFADIRGSITPGSLSPAPNNNSGELMYEHEKEWQRRKEAVDGDVSKAEVPSLNKSYGSMSRQEMMDAYDRMRYGDNFDKAREAMGKAKDNPFDSTNNPAKFLVNEEGQKKAVKQGIEMNKHFFAPGGGREREINNRSAATSSAAPSLSDISTSNKGDGRAAFATSSQRAKDDAAKAGTLKPITDAVNKVKSWLTGNSSGAGWSALGPTIKFAEGTHRMGKRSYNTGFGYSMFDDLSKHPDKLYKTGGKPTSAAGAYQFITPTWNRAASALDLKDFGPESQERAGEWLTQERGVQTQKPFTTVAELKDAFKKISPEWASIPDPDTGKSAYDGDGVNSARAFEDLRKFYEKQVGYRLKD